MQHSEFAGFGIQSEKMTITDANGEPLEITIKAPTVEEAIGKEGVATSNYDLAAACIFHPNGEQLATAEEWRQCDAGTFQKVVGKLTSFINGEEAKKS